MNLELIFLKQLKTILSSKDSINDAVAARESLRLKYGKTEEKISLNDLYKVKAINDKGEIAKTLPNDPDKTIWVDMPRINGSSKDYFFNKKLSQYQKVILEAAISGAHLIMFDIAQSSLKEIQNIMNQLPLQSKDRNDEEEAKFRRLTNQSQQMLTIFQSVPEKVMRTIGEQITFKALNSCELTKEASKAIDDAIATQEQKTQAINSIIKENDTENVFKIKYLFLNKLQEILSSKELINTAIESRRILKQGKEEKVCSLKTIEDKNIFDKHGEIVTEKAENFGLKLDYDIKVRLVKAANEYKFSKNLSTREKIIFEAVFYSASEHVNNELITNGDSNLVMQNLMAVNEVLTNIRPQIGPHLKLTSNNNYELSDTSNGLLNQLNQSINEIKDRKEETKRQESEETKRQEAATKEQNKLARRRKVANGLSKTGRYITGLCGASLGLGGAAAAIESGILGASIMSTTTLAVMASHVALAVVGGFALVGLALIITGLFFAFSSNKAKKLKENNKPKIDKPSSSIIEESDSLSESSSLEVVRLPSSSGKGSGSQNKPEKKTKVRDDSDELENNYESPTPGL